MPIKPGTETTDSTSMSVTALLENVNAALVPEGAKAELALTQHELRVSFVYAKEPDAEQLVRWFLAQLNQHEWPGVERVILEGRAVDGLDYDWRTTIAPPFVALSLKLPKPVPSPNDAWKSVLAGVGLASAVIAVAYGGYWGATSRTRMHEVVQEIAPPKKAVAKAMPRPKPRPTEPQWVDPASVGQPYGDKVRGLLTFRGNPTRTFYGTGPMPTAPKVLWRYPEKPMCANSREKGQTFLWCGTGWTGQPAVFERGGKTWLVFGAYDKGVHFVDASRGKRLLAPFMTGDIIKGSVTVDPDGFPIVYSGSRDGHFRAIGFDGPKPRELWRLSAHSVGPTMWNDDWDGAALVLDDHLFIGGENSRVHIAKLNRGYAPDGSPTVAPKLVFHAAGWDKELVRKVGDRNMSIENSLALSGNRMFFSNSGGLAQAWDIAGLKQGKTPRRVFRYWTGDDTDASIVVDRAGALYVASEWERLNDQARRVGQLVKLDPSKKDPLVWSVSDRQGKKSGLWATPALYEDVVVFATHGGVVKAVDKDDASVRWQMKLKGKTWQSPVIVDGILIQGDCSGDLSAFDIRDTRAKPKKLWTVNLGGCIESTPAVWDGKIYVGSRSGYMYAIGDALPTGRR